VTGGVTTNNDFLALFFPDVHHHVAVERGARESVYCKARLKAGRCFQEGKTVSRAHCCAAFTKQSGTREPFTDTSCGMYCANARVYYLAESSDRGAFHRSVTPQLAQPPFRARSTTTSCCSYSRPRYLSRGLSPAWWRLCPHATWAAA